jgi:hypothetical protein
MSKRDEKETKADEVKREEEKVGDKSTENAAVGGENDDDEPCIQIIVPTTSAIITAPRVCPPGYRLDATGKCRKIMK